MIHYTPNAVIKMLMEQQLNALFETQIASGELDFLVDKCICIEVNNLSLYLLFSLDAQTKKMRLLVLKSTFICEQMARFDGKLSGSSDSFLMLIAGKYDPDTLFFRRQLSIEGDTELCLMFKNWLDTQEPQDLLPHQLYADLQRYVTQLP
ncbi:ubiquinone anaerobic biosynthesis accessory factor UbiT [Pseudoalteromonas sp. T1lg23B]|uniref:ubiquinone anaerobic biosynthesis accessory factor UbiT n=1 Tax=Pseudoalteromonas sp. T1lg23B TaxID=2077097 RepID=UPI001F2C58F2|nr:SCP2 sterol-binding domain-containing protein [Pseudoalteromonas sp. T1lg23B]